jgi:hypothetical protein
MALLGVAGMMLIGSAVIPVYANGHKTASQAQSGPRTQAFIGEIQAPSENREWVDPILYDQSRQTNYYIDDWKAERFDGHAVKIIGTLDEKNAIIHPTSIEVLN